MTDEESTNQGQRSEPSESGEWDHKKDKFEQYHHYKSRRSMFFGLVGFIVLLFLVFGFIGVAVFGHSHNNKIGRVNNVAVERNFGGAGMNGMMGRGEFNGSESVTGKVTAVNGKTFTMNVGSNTTKNVQISDSTRFPISSNTNISVGDSVTVHGGQDSNGIIQATLITIN